MRQLFVGVQDYYIRTRVQGDMGSIHVTQPVPKPDVKDKTCFNCGKKGHLAENCPEPKKCSHCGKKGHVAKDCWEKHPDKKPKAKGKAQPLKPFGKDRKPTGRGTGKGKGGRRAKGRGKGNKFRGVDEEDDEDDQDYDDYEEEDQGDDNPEPEADPSGGGSVNQIHEQMTMCVKKQNAGTSRTEEQPVTEAHRVDEINLSEKFQSIGVGDPKRRWLDPKHEVLPTDLFMPGRHPSAAKQADIQALIRLIHREVQSDPQCITCYKSLTFGIDLAGQAEKRERQVTVEDGLNRSSLPSRNGPIRSDPRELEAFTSQHLSLSANFWTWWRTQEVPKANPAVAPHLLARKYLKGAHEWVNIPRGIVEELVKHSRGAVIQSVEHLPVVQGACSISKVVLQDCFDVIDTLQESVSFVPNDEVSNQAKGLGSMLSFWERMRNVCPKVNSYNGPILNKERRQCVTSRDLDEAMLETRHFWFEAPTKFDDAWQPILEVYSQADRWPSIPPPSREVCLSTLLHTKDSSPGPDGIPYSAWRLLPEMTLQAMSSYFYDIQEETALPPTQVGVGQNRTHS